ncbi:MAG: YfiR family protein [Gammaproteobacteria bacterium]|nr:YfiR family protein [Gammaproteobacteria bacterium]
MITFRIFTLNSLPSLLIPFLLSGYTGIALLNGAVAAPMMAEEYEIKAVYLYNLGSFITWPDSVLKHPNTSFRICVLGEDPCQQSLDIATNNEKVKGHAVEIRLLHKLEQIDSCHILFVSASEQQHLSAILARAKLRFILCVSDIPEFIVQGGMVEFFIHSNKVRLAINPEALQEAQLRANANLLGLARIVQGKKK